MDWVALVGVDWGGEQHAYTIQERDGTRSSGVTKSSPEELAAWIRQLREKYPTGTLIMAVEQGCSSLLYALAEYEFVAIVPINPRASSSYRESLRLSGASSDPTDAELICEFAVKHLSGLRVWCPDDAITRRTRTLAEHRRTLVDQRTAATHTLSAALKVFFPQCLKWFGSETSPLLLGFLRQWSTLDQARGASVEQIESLLRAMHCRKVQARARAQHDEIAGATDLLRDATTVEVWSRYAQAQIAMITTLNEQIDLYENSIAEAWENHPDREIFESLPGAGAVLAPRLAAAFGTDRARYDSADQIACYSGIAPVKEQSGRRCWVHARWSYPTFLHQTFHEFAECSIPRSAWAGAVYHQQRARGADHHEAIRALAFRWIRILFRLWKDRLVYDEQVHIERLRQTQAPILNRLAA